MTRSIHKLVLAAGAIALILAAGGAAAVSGKAPKPPKGLAKAPDDFGGTHSGEPGVRNVVLTTEFGVRKGKLTRFPVAIGRWGMAAHSASCGEVIPKALSLSRQGTVAHTPDLDFGPVLRVRKRRFSHQDAYDVPQQYGTDHVDYRFEGRFQSPRRVAGTVVVNVVRNFADGRVETCSTGVLTWSACAGDLDPLGPAKPCLGTDPEGNTEPL